MKVFKRVIKYFRSNIHKILTLIFYDNKYLVGVWFEKNNKGWLWGSRNLYNQKIRGINKHIPWPVSNSIIINGPLENLIVHPDDYDNFQGYGVYYQCFSAKIIIGKGTQIANNVGFITANHNPLKVNEHLPGKDIVLGNDCWIGMNVVILPGVTLGDNTVVGAGSVVTKSFPSGHCIIAGNPAKVLKQLG